MNFLRFQMAAQVLVIVGLVGVCGACGAGSAGADALNDAGIDVPIDLPGDQMTDAKIDDIADGVGDVAVDALPDAVAELDVVADGDADSRVVTDVATDAALDADATDIFDKPFRVAVVSDCHVLQLELDKKPNRYVVELLRNISRAEGSLAAVFALGDNIEDMFVWYEEARDGLPIPVLEVFNRIFAENLSVPWYLALGNHDVRFVDTFHELNVPITRWLQYFDGTGHLPARWYSVKMGGFNFVVLFSSDGAVDHETNDTNILLQEQIDWLNQELELGMPTILLYHIWLEPPVSLPETPDAMSPTFDDPPLHPIFQAVVDHPGVVRAAFSGHGHASRHHRFQDVDFYEVRDAKTADASDEKGSRNDYLDVVFDPVAMTVTIANYHDIDWEFRP